MSREAFMDGISDTTLENVLERHQFDIDKLPSTCILSCQSVPPSTSCSPIFSYLIPFCFYPNLLYPYVLSGKRKSILIVGGKEREKVVAIQLGL
jgi:hypothetical protein